MFDDSMLKVVEIDGEPHYRFKPNTIMYAVPVNSELGRKIGQSEFGIIFHTTYDSLDSGASFGADISNLKQAPGVWFDDAFFTDDTGTVTLTEDEEQRIIQLVKSADSVNQRINYNDLPLDLLNIYINSEIKSGYFIEDAEKSFEGFISWYKERLRKRVAKLKSEKGRNRVINKGQQDISNFEDRREDFLNLFRVSRFLFEAKNIFIEKYNNAVYNTKHFVDDGSGDLVASNPEGYVAVDHEGNGVKFVDRLEFSRANFMVDKGDKFTNESINFTINVSKDVKITKTLKEWTYEIKKAGHVPGNVPSFVYNELINGGLVVESVREEDAQEVIYNTVYAYINSLNEEETIDLEVVDATSADMTPSAAPNVRIAVVPGAFKPPHRGHLAMVEQYAANNEHVKVLISNPLNRQRTLEDGTVITAVHAKRMWEALAGHLPNVSIEVSPAASPLTAAYEFVGKDGDLNPGDVVSLGASTKGGDWKRWVGAQKYVKDGVELLDPQTTAVEPSIHSPEYMALLENTDLYEDMPSVRDSKKDPRQFHASDMRYLLAKAKENEEAVELLEDFVGDEGTVMDFLSILGIDTGLNEPLAETSAMSGGAVAGGVEHEDRDDPLDGRSRSIQGRRKKKSTNENIDMSLVMEVYELLIERGIKL